MKEENNRLLLWLAGIGIVCLIFDSRTAADSIRDSLELCINTLIPNLFAFMILSGLIAGHLHEISIPWLRKIINFPHGTEGLFLIGLMGGFPIGANAIVQAMDQKQLSKDNGEILLGLCNHCGPAFIFGVIAPLFGSLKTACIIFLIQIISAALVAGYWPGNPSDAHTSNHQAGITLIDAVNRATRAMVNVCAWVITAGIIIAFLRKWLFPFIPPLAQIWITGFLELTSGCFGLPAQLSEATRLILICGFVNFGGISVILQIRGVVSGHNISMKTCICQKAVQAVAAMALNALYCFISPWILSVPAAILMKKAVAIPRKLMYNRVSKGGV